MLTVASNPTEQVAQWFESDTMRQHLETLVRAWNASELLGIDLADQLRDIVQESAAKGGVTITNLNGVDWSLLAERYAEEICGVDEDELTRRREKYQHDRQQP